MPQPEFSDLSSRALGLQGPPRVLEAAAEPLELPPLDELLELLAQLCELLGPGRCAAAYQLYSPAELPEAFEGELVDQRALLRRLARYADEDDESLPIELVDGRSAELGDFADHLAGSLAFAGFVGEQHERASFVVFDLGDQRAMLGPSCIELARAVVHRARIVAAGGGYRDDDAQRGHGDELPTELDGFLACFALGWGLPVTNACLDPRSAGGKQSRDIARLAWVTSSLRFPPDVAARLLAVIYRAGGRDEAFVEARREALNPSQRELFDEVWAELDGEASRLRDQLRWGAPKTWPEPAEPALEELVFDAHDEVLLDAQARHDARIRQPNVGRPVFRARPKRTLLGVLLGGLVGLIFGLPGVVIGAVSGALAGSRVRGSVCSAPRCGANLSPDDETCGKCGGTVVGEIERAKEHLAALEEFEARAALDAR